MRHLSAGLLRDECGVGITEFALIAPALCMTLFGLFELSHTIYTSTMLEGAIQKAARDSSIEGASTSASIIDTRVRTAVKRIAPRATVQFQRKAYTNYADFSRPEDFNDIDGNGACDNNEPFEDINGNNHWDADRGTTGHGGARDAVLYTVTVTYRRFFPVAEFIGMDPDVTTVARTVLRNQPYGQQNMAVRVGNCA